MPRGSRAGVRRGSPRMHGCAPANVRRAGNKRANARLCCCCRWPGAQRRHATKTASAGATTWGTWCGAAARTATASTGATARTWTRPSPRRPATSGARPSAISVRATAAHATKAASPTAPSLAAAQNASPAATTAAPRTARAVVTQTATGGKSTPASPPRPRVCLPVPASRPHGRAPSRLAAHMTDHVLCCARRTRIHCQRRRVPHPVCTQPNTRAADTPAGNIAAAATGPTPFRPPVVRVRQKHGRLGMCTRRHCHHTASTPHRSVLWHTLPHGNGRIAPLWQHSRNSLWGIPRF